MTTQTDAGRRGLFRKKVVVLIAVAGIILAAAAVVAVGLLSSAERVWVGQFDTNIQSEPGERVVVHRELWGDPEHPDRAGVAILYYNSDGHCVGALLEDSTDPEAIGEQLKEAGRDSRAAFARVKTGWIIRGTVATRAVDREGHGFQAAKYRFSTTATEIKAGG
jgi:hypothetical protein